jgi:hypothetical protein
MLSGTLAASMSILLELEREVTSARRVARTKRTASTRWSSRVSQTSDALDLDDGVFKLRSARAIAASLKRSAERSKRRKSSPFRSAMSMLNFEINRAGRNLSPERRRTLERAKSALRRQFGRP